LDFDPAPLPADLLLSDPSAAKVLKPRPTRISSHRNLPGPLAWSYLRVRSPT